MRKACNELKAPPAVNGCNIAPAPLVRKTALFEPFIYKMMILPRQARDKHREKLQKGCRFLQDGLDACACSVQHLYQYLSDLN
eukprot:COSAG06_NODE_1003_length_11130_cov_5.230804_5_plen_83_part_00